MGLLSELRPKKGSKTVSKRLGRGVGSGKGGTSTKGHKGQKARSGAPIARGFEGGQTPMARRLPKFGFTNGKFKKTYEILNLKDLEALAKKASTTELSPETLSKIGFMSAKAKLKILGEGEMSQGISVKAHKFSETAKTAIEKAGGKAEVL